jgi:hypothetical protein
MRFRGLASVALGAVAVVCAAGAVAAAPAFAAGGPKARHSHSSRGHHNSGHGHNGQGNNGQGNNGQGNNGHGNNGGLSVNKVAFGTATEPYTGNNETVYQYTLSNARGMSVQILTYGGIVQAINVPWPGQQDRRRSARISDAPGLRQRGQPAGDGQWRALFR